jgi:hypothetical protein
VRQWIRNKEIKGTIERKKEKKQKKTKGNAVKL